MDPADVKTQWRQTFGTEPPEARQEFLLANLAYQQQVKAHGGLSAKTVRQLETLAGQGNPSLKAPLTLRPGTRFVRLWQGVPHEVTVLEDGRYLYKDEHFKSLSAIATKVTGTRWNGKTFFGLKKEKVHG